MTPLVEFILARSSANVMSIGTVFGIDINLVHFHMVSQANCKTIYFVTELTLITCKLLCLKSAYNCFLSWDLIWLGSLAVDKQTLMQMLQTCSGWNVSRIVVKTCFWNGLFKMECLNFHALNALLTLWIIFSILINFCHQLPVSKIYTNVDMKVRLTVALNKRGFVCVWRAGQ